MDTHHREEVALVNSEWHTRLEAEAHQSLVLTNRVRHLECELAARSVFKDEAERLARDLKHTRVELEESEKVDYAAEILARASVADLCSC